MTPFGTQRALLELDGSQVSVSGPSAGIELEYRGPMVADEHYESRRLRISSLFSGIGGLDLGLENAGHRIVEMCESWEPARRVLSDKFPEVTVADDVRTYTPSRDYEVLTAGFPCTDISHAGSKAGIFGEKSGLVEHAFRIARETEPEWIVLENVTNLLTLHGGAGIAHIVHELVSMGYSWAYRSVDTRFTGLPQKRTRVLILASKAHDPAAVLFRDDAGPPDDEPDDSPVVSGFYWTEGRHGLGLVRNAIPTLKGGSPLGIPSAPAVWFPHEPHGRKFILPTVEDGEALQGFERGWTKSASVPGEPDLRWKLIGNAVPVDVAAWIGRLLARPISASQVVATPLTISRGKRWPAAAFGAGGEAYSAAVSLWPERIRQADLADVVRPAVAAPLSHRAATGFLSRLDEAGMRVSEQFYADLEQHQQTTRPKLTDSRASWASSDSSRKRMQGQRQKDTKPEIELRRQLHRRGIRYRLQTRPVPDLRSRLDVVISSAKVAIDIRGCFWHRCPDHGTAPRLNKERWAAKLDRNVQRDAEIVTALQERGWEVVVVWEHDDMGAKASEIATLVRQRRIDRPWMSAPRRTVDS